MLQGKEEYHIDCTVNDRCESILTVYKCIGKRFEFVRQITGDEAEEIFKTLTIQRGYKVSDKNLHMKFDENEQLVEIKQKE